MSKIRETPSNHISFRLQTELVKGLTTYAKSINLTRSELLRQLVTDLLVTPTTLDTQEAQHISAPESRESINAPNFGDVNTEEIDTQEAQHVSQTPQHWSQAQ